MASKMSTLCQLVTAVRAVTGDASLHLLCDSDAQSDGPAAGPATDNTKADNPSTAATATTAAPRRTGRQHKPAAEYCRSCPCSPWGGSMSPPRAPSLQLLSLNVNGLRERQKRAALFAVLQAGPWHVIALQETHHATQAEAAQWCREGAGPTAPWDGPSFWAAGTSASRGVALLFKAGPLLSEVSAYATDPCGRFIAA